MALKLLRAIKSSGGRSKASDAEKQEWLTQIREMLDGLYDEGIKAVDWVAAQRLAIDPSPLYYRLNERGTRWTVEKSKAETRHFRKKQPPVNQSLSNT